MLTNLGDLVADAQTGQIDLSKFSHKSRPGRHQIDITVNKISGGNVDYINTKHLEAEPTQTTPSDKSHPLNIQFINVNTQTIHEHQVAELYNSPLRMMDIKIGMIFKLGE